MPKVSIIMPTYNGARFIGDAIKSALSQTFQDFEIIVTDDGSTDNTGEIVKNYAEKDKRIRYYSRTRNGVAAAYNFCIKEARGIYISIFEHDDISMPERLEKQIEILDAHKEISILYSSLQTFNSYGSLGDIYAPYTKSAMSQKECFRALVTYGSFPNNPSVTIRKEVYEHIRYDERLENYGLGHDFLFYLQASQKFNFYYLNTPLVLWRRSPNSLSEKSLDNFKASEAVIKRLYLNKQQIFGITYRQALSMTYIRHARLAINSVQFSNKYLIYLFYNIKAFLNNPFNLAVYKTIIWMFTKRIRRKYSRQHELKRTSQQISLLKAEQ
ncbi:MAG: glycosyltransferase family 2 protein [Candidatus Omnitrophota bacterium]